MKKNIKIIFVIFIIIMVFMFCSQVYAKTKCSVCGGDGTYGGGVKCTTCGGTGYLSGGDAGGHSTGDIIAGAEGFINKGESEGNKIITPSKLQDISDVIYNVLFVIGVVAAVIVGLILGIKFILGSVEEKAEIKAMLIPYVFGCIVIFGAFGIWKIVVDILQTL